MTSSQTEKLGDAQFECQACCMRFTTKNKKKQHMKTEDHKTRYAIQQAIAKQDKDSTPRGPIYYMNRTVENGFIMYFDLDDKDAEQEVIRAGRINCTAFAYCQMDEIKILQVEQNYQGRSCRMMRINSRDDVRMWQLANYLGEARNFSTICRANSNVAFLIGGLHRLVQG